MPSATGTRYEHGKVTVLSTWRGLVDLKHRKIYERGKIKSNFKRKTFLEKGMVFNM
jgi:hypothetical protein